MGRFDDAEIGSLVRRAQRGDLAAFEGLVRTFEGPMFSLALRMTNNRADADDLTQEIFVKAYRAIRKFRRESKFSTWLYTLATNTCLSGLRRLRRIADFETARLDAPQDGQDGPPAVTAVDPADRPDAALQRGEARARIGAVLATLPADFRAALILRDVQGLSYEEVAAAMDCSIGTVKSRLSRARNLAKERLVREGLVCAVKR